MRLREVDTMETGCQKNRRDPRLTDALNAAGEEFGLARLQAAFKSVCHLDSQGIVNALQHAIDDFTGDEPVFDDQTLVVIKRDASLLQ